MTTGRFLALEDPDGVGKTTLVERIADLSYLRAVDRLAGSSHPDTTPLVFVSRRQLSGTSIYSAALMDHLAQMLWHSGDGRDLPDSFWMTLQATWFTAHSTANAGTLFDRRLARFRPSELGLHAGYTGLGRDTFVTYQTLGQQRLTEMSAVRGWSQLHVGPEETVDATASRLAALIASLRDLRPQHPGFDRVPRVHR